MSATRKLVTPPLDGSGPKEREVILVDSGSGSVALAIGICIGLFYNLIWQGIAWLVGGAS